MTAVAALDSPAPRRMLLEWFARGAQAHVPTTRLAAALRKKQDAAWDEWLLHAADVLGWEAERIEASPKAIQGDHDAWWVTRNREGHEQWLVFSGVGGDDAAATLLDAQHIQDVSPAPDQIARKLELDGADRPVTWVRLAPELPLQRLRSSPHGPRLKPRQRLVRWAKLERRTILAVVAYSTVIGSVALALPLAVQTLVDLLAFGRVLQPLLVIVVTLFVVLVLAASLRVLEVYIVELLQRRVFTNLARDFARRLPAARRSASGKWGLTERINRFFDVTGAQKASASLLLSATEVVMSAAAGLLILAFYHPYLLVFDLVVLGALAFVVLRLGRGGIDSAVAESGAKYDVAAWLESVAREQRRFMTPEGASWSSRRTDQLVVDWLTKRRDHFSVVLRQTIGFAGIQALASGTLLGLGGFLVWNNQLSLGQLVAAELIVTGVTAQMAKFGKHAESFYDLNASVDKLGLLIDLDTESRSGDLLPSQDDPMKMEIKALSLAGKPCSFTVEPGERMVLDGMPFRARRALFDAVYGRDMDNAKCVFVDDVRLDSLAPRSLRRQVALLRHPQAVGATLEDHLTHQDMRSTAMELRELLEKVGLGDWLASQPDGLQTWIRPDGFPLKHNQLVALEVARVIREKPRLLLIDHALDHVVEPDRLDLLWEALAGESAPWTLVVASERKAILERLDRRYDWAAAPEEAPSQ